MATHSPYYRNLATPRPAWHEPSFVWMAAGIAAAFAIIGTLIIAGAGSSPVGQVMAVLVGFLVLGVGGVFALAGAASGRLAGRGSGDWPW
ncbi:MAG: hypothetical protein ABIS17_06775 [Casimicrobiaceae bacterium]